MRESSSSHGVVLPPGSTPRVELSGDSQTVKIITVRPENGHKDGKPVASHPDGTVLHNVVTEYPDGHVRHHQVRDVPDLLAKISGQLKNRYNLKSFDFQKFPAELKDGEAVTVGGITYGA